MATVGDLMDILKIVFEMIQDLVKTLVEKFSSGNGEEQPEE